MIIAIDFDGTCVTHEFPNVGKDIGAVPVLKKLSDAGHKLILYTMRSNVEAPKSDDYNIVPIAGQYLEHAVAWFNHNGIPLFGIQENPTQKTWTHSPKCYAEMYIDDAALGCPLIFTQNERPYVDWNTVEKILCEKGLI